MCECITKLNSILNEKNLEVSTVISLSGGITRIAIPLEKKGKAKDIPIIAAAFCPICGQEY
jgi:hypothetical protein